MTVTRFVHEKRCVYVTVSTPPYKFYGLLLTPKRRLPMWVGRVHQTRRAAFNEARKHIADAGWKLLPGGMR